MGTQCAKSEVQTRRTESGEIDEEVRSREARKKQIALFLRMFEKQEADVEFDSGTFVAMVEKVIVNRNENGKGIDLRFILRNGREMCIEI